MQHIAGASGERFTGGVQDARKVRLALDEIAVLLSFTGAPSFKARAYERGARAVEALGDELGPRVEQGTLTEVEGIGPSLAREIHELWNSGLSALLERLRAAAPEGTAELVQVDGMTPKRVQALHAALGITSVDALLEACRAGRVRGVKGMGEKTEQKLRAAAERWLGRHDEVVSVLRSDALRLFDRVQVQLHAAGASQVELAGGLRRGEETASELSVVVSGDADASFRALSRLPNVVRVDEDARVVRLREGVTVRPKFTSTGEFGAELLRATGPEAYVASLGTLPPATSEAALYDALGTPWVPPERRHDPDRSRDHRLLCEADIRGMVHCHTLYSDGRDDIEAMARAAEAHGFSYITITDHSPSAHYAQGTSLDRLKAQWDEIDEVQAKVAIRILRGTESDILEDGALDYPDGVLERFDVVIASIHARHRMDAEAMTVRLTRALSWPGFKIWGHPLGRILLHREPFACDLPRVLDVLAASRGALELNADPHRLDLPAALIPLGRERGIPFVVSADAHSTRGLSSLAHGILQARRGGLTKDDVLNTLEADAFAAKVKPR